MASFVAVVEGIYLVLIEKIVTVNCFLEDYDIKLLVILNTNTPTK